MRGRLVVSALAVFASFALTLGPAFAATTPPRSAPIAVEWAPREAGEPIMAIVSLKSQQVTFYDADGWILRAPVSTGTTGRETPAGVFAVLEKDKDHHSTMYDDAWMPNMQRITWNGLALHGGPLPGYAASHGCVRMPYDVAEQMFDKTRIGMRVIISPDDAAPVDFSDPALLMPDPAAIAAAPAHAETLANDAADAADTADEAKKTSAAVAHDAASLVASVRKLQSVKTRAEAQRASADKSLAAADQADARARNLEQTAAAEAADLATQLKAAIADAKAEVDATLASTDTVNTNDEARKADAAAAARMDALHELGVLKTRADARHALADKTLTAADQADARARNLEQAAAAKAADLATQLDAAKTDANAKAVEATADADAMKTARTDSAAAAKAASEAKLLLEPVSIYISRATQTLYVRRNTHKPAPDGGGEVFDSTIEVPITIRDPDKPIGTHVFTAIAESDSGLRWTAVTIDNGDDAKDALDRITIPQDVLDRIAPTALPRSSIIISDEPLSRETNYRTEFVAVLNNYPQGGFLTRQPSSEVIATQDDSGFNFFSLFQGGGHHTRKDPPQQGW